MSAARVFVALRDRLLFSTHEGGVTEATQQCGSEPYRDWLDRTIIEHDGSVYSWTGTAWQRTRAQVQDFLEQYREESREGKR